MTMHNSLIIDEENGTVSGNAVITLGEDWLVKAFIKKHHLHDNLQSEYVRVEDLPRLLRQYYSVSLYCEHGLCVSILACEEVLAEGCTYLMEAQADLPGNNQVESASAGIRSGAFMRSSFSAWLGEDVSIRLPGSKHFFQVRELAADGAGSEDDDQKLVYRCVAHQFSSSANGVKSDISGGTLPRMVRLVLSASYLIEEVTGEPEHPCVLHLALQPSGTMPRGNCKPFCALEMLGRQVSEYELSTTGVNGDALLY